MRRRSFDVFDTLLTRSAAIPRDLFLSLGEQLAQNGLIAIEAADFARARSHAESVARRLRPEPEVTLAEIYASLAQALQWNQSVKERAMTMELECERRGIQPVPEMLPRVREARKAAESIFFLSDMYLPEWFITELLTREGFCQKSDTVLVSGERRASKRSGAMFRLVMKDYGATQDWIHTGDDSVADVEVPRRLGITAVHFTQAKLTSDELAARGAAIVAPGWRSCLAGAMRLARLANPKPQLIIGLFWESACDVAGPLLLGFAHWCLECAARHGWKRLYFISRDGQIVLRIAQALAKEWNFPIECRYLYGSRRAWRTAALVNIIDSDLDWLLPPNSYLTPRQVFARLGMDATEAGERLAAEGWRPQPLDDPLSRQANEDLRSLLASERVRQFAQEASREKALLARAYLRQEGLFDGSPFSIVDIGWFGNMQRALERLLNPDHERQSVPVFGLYLGLSPLTKVSGKMWDYWSQLKDSGQPIGRQALSLLEAFMSADHPTVLGYEHKRGQVVPMLQPTGGGTLSDWGIQTLQSAIMEFVRRFANSCRRENFPGPAYQAVTRALFERLSFHPTADEARVWGSCQHLDDQIERGSGRSSGMSIGAAFIAVCRPEKRPPNWWPEGDLAIRSNWVLRLFLLSRRLRWRVEDWKRNDRS